jgi:phage/plasmid-like protein (TIGR03299 family)
MAAGVTSQVYNSNSKRPWHGGGTPLDPSLSVVDALASDRLLGSRIVACPSMIGAPNGAFIDWPNKVAHVREADNAIVGEGSDKFALMQHADLGAFADRLASDFGLQFEIAGLLRNGSQFVLQAKLGEPVVVGKLPDGRDDVVAGYLTLGTSHDGKRSTEIGFAAMRAECANMVAIAMQQSRDGRHYHRIPHLGDQTAKLDNVERILRQGFHTFDEFVAFAQAAAQTAMHVEQFDAFALQLVPDVEGTSNARRSSKRDELRELYQVGIGNDGRTAWDAYNAITEWANYRAPVRGARLDDAARNLVRVESTLWGQGASLATDAQDLLQRVYVLS